MAQQTTAVNILFFEIAKIMGDAPRLSDTIISKMKDARKRAKEEQKKQMMDFANWCRIQQNKNPDQDITIEQLFQEYYTQTFYQ